MRTVLILIVLLLTLCRLCLAQPVRDFTMHVDVVELIDHGKQVDGVAAITTVHGKHTYSFATEENKATFLKSPVKYEIQMGGACGRMGPLSGNGTTKLFAVHNGKLYVFASESCRMTFQAGPDKFIDSDDPAPAFTDESRKLGRAMLGKAVDAISCVAGIDNLTTYRQMLVREEKSGDKMYRVTTAVTLMFPDKFRSDVCWNDSCWGNFADNTTGWMTSNDSKEPMHPQQRIALQRETLHPLTILRNRDSKDLIISATGEKRTITIPEEGDVPLDLVTVHRAGTTAVLGLDDKYRIRLMALRDRGPNSTIGNVEHIYSQFNDVGGLRLPKRIDVSFDGKPVPNQSGVFAEQVINDPKDATRFEIKPIE